MSAALIGGLAATGGAIAGLGGSILNYQNQKDQLRWQKQMYASQMMREDNAVQRRAADLEAAGLSKTLAAGQAAQAGSAPNLTAPQFNSEPISRGAAATLGLIQQEANIAQTREQEKLAKAQQLESFARTEQAQAITGKIPSDIALQKAQAAQNYSASNLAGKNAAEVNYNLEWKKATGQGPHPSIVGGTAHDATASILRATNQGPFGPIAGPQAEKMEYKEMQRKLIESQRIRKPRKEGSIHN